MSIQTGSGIHDCERVHGLEFKLCESENCGLRSESSHVRTLPKNTVCRHYLVNELEKLTVSFLLFLTCSVGVQLVV